MANAHGYIALHRGIFEHPLFKDDRPFTRMQAWLWLISTAAWCVGQQRVGRVVTTVERGQLAATNRSLGKTWGWPEGRVRRFLKTLKGEAMIRSFVTDAVADSPPDALSKGAVTVITICNYSKFQNPSTRVNGEPTHPPTHPPTRDKQQVLDLDDENSPEESNQQPRLKKKRGFGENSGDRREAADPYRNRHGAVSKKRGTIFIKKGTDEWPVYAADYKAVRGADPLPNRYGGFWFKLNGEASVQVFRQGETWHPNPARKRA